MLQWKNVTMLSIIKKVFKKMMMAYLTVSIKKLSSNQLEMYFKNYPREQPV